MSNTLNTNSQEHSPSRSREEDTSNLSRFFSTLPRQPACALRLSPEERLKIVEETKETLTKDESPLPPYTSARPVLRSDFQKTATYSVAYTTLGFLYEEGDDVYPDSDFQRGLQMRYLGWGCSEAHFLLKYVSRHYFAKYATMDFLVEGLTYPQGSWQNHSAMYAMEVVNGF